MYGLEKDVRRKDKFDRSKKYFENHPYAKKKKSDTMREPYNADEKREFNIGTRSGRAEHASRIIEFCESEHMLEKIIMSFDNSIFYDENSDISSPIDSNFKTLYKFVVTDINDYIFSQRDGLHVGVLNNASAKNPGGGFVNGAIAQEEALCMKSTLYPVLHRLSEIDESFYSYNNSDSLQLYYKSAAIYTPHVLMICDNNYEFTEDTFEFSVISCAAVNVKAMRDSAFDQQKVYDEMKLRVKIILYAAAVNGVKHIILTDWGCGVFGNSIDYVIKFFMDELNGPQFSNVFAVVSFISNNSETVKRMEEVAGFSST